MWFRNLDERENRQVVSFHDPDDGSNSQVASSRGPGRLLKQSGRLVLGLDDRSNRQVVSSWGLDDRSNRQVVSSRGLEDRSNRQVVSSRGLADRSNSKAVW